MRARALVMLMLFTALRISETVALDIDDVRSCAQGAFARPEPTPPLPRFSRKLRERPKRRPYPAETSSTLAP